MFCNVEQVSLSMLQCCDRFGKSVVHARMYV